MRKPKLIVLFILCFVSIGLYAQPQWKERKLTWDDFSGSIDLASPFIATTHSSINYSYTWANNNNGHTLILNITHVFNKAKSWIKPDGETDDLLAHEQLHFDINELFARRFFAQFKEKIYTTNLPEEIKMAFSQLITDAQNMNDKYDSETAHSKNRKKQKEWEANINTQLNAISPY